MGEHTELMVKEWQVPREEQDEIAYRSHMNAHQATQDGRLTAEIHPLDLDLAPRFVDDPATDDTGYGWGGAPVVDMGAYEYQPDCNDNGVLDADDIATDTWSSSDLSTTSLSASSFHRMQLRSTKGPLALGLTGAPELEITSLPRFPLNVQFVTSTAPSSL